MPADDLNSIPGLQDKHLRALARAQLADLHGFASADQREIYKAMGNIRPRPSLERISQWQEEARSRLDEPEADAADWHTVASFAVIFAQRQAGDTWERRVEAEQTEVEPEQDPQAWAGWDFGPVGDWIASRLHAADSAGTPVPPVTERPVTEPPVTERPEAAQPVAAPVPGRSQLSIESAAIIDAGRRFALISGGVLAAEPPPELMAPVRAAFTVGGARPGTILHAVIRILRPDGPGWNPQDPVVPQGSGQAEFDLSRIPAGQYEMSLIAWAPDASAKPVSVRLPAVAIRSAPG